MKDEDLQVGCLYFILLISIFVLWITAMDYKEKINKLEKENVKLKQENKDYKWQIDQVPYVIESWCNGE